MMSLLTDFVSSGLGALCKQSPLMDVLLSTRSSTICSGITVKRKQHVVGEDGSGVIQCQAHGGAASARVISRALAAAAFQVDCLDGQVSHFLRD